MSPWRRKSRRVILEALADAKLLGIEGEELMRFIRSRYPFGERAMHPYKIWLSEVALLVKGEKPARPKAEDDRTPLPGQLDLFSKEEGRS